MTKQLENALKEKSLHSLQSKEADADQVDTDKWLGLKQTQKDS